MGRCTGRGRIPAGVDLVVATLERDDVLCPEQTHHLDLLFVATRPVAEVHAEGLVLHLVPPDAHAEAELAARQHVDFGGLLGDEHGLTLRKDEHAGDELEVCVRGKEPEQHEDLVERCFGVVRTAPIRPRREVRADHVVVGHQEREPALLGRAPEADDEVGIVADLGLGERDADLHVHQYGSEWTTAPSPSSR